VLKEIQVDTGAQEPPVLKEIQVIPELTGATVLRRYW